MNRYHPLILGFTAGVLLVVTGCTGRGEVRAVPFARSDFTRQEPLIQTVPVEEAYYWLREDGTVGVALGYHGSSLFGRAFDADWRMSLVLEDLPAGREKLYRLGPQSARVAQSVGGDQRRARSLTGVAVLQAPRGNRLTGRFHLTVRQQQFTLLGGWSPSPYQAPMWIVVGEFEAVLNATRGEAILAETEANGFDRQPQRPATRPSSSATRPIISP